GATPDVVFLAQPRCAFALFLVALYDALHRHHSAARAGRAPVRPEADGGPHPAGRSTGEAGAGTRPCIAACTGETAARSPASTGRAQARTTAGAGAAPASGAADPAAHASAAHAGQRRTGIEAGAGADAGADAAGAVPRAYGARPGCAGADRTRAGCAGADGAGTRCAGADGAAANRT